MNRSLVVLALPLVAMVACTAAPSPGPTAPPMATSTPCGVSAEPSGGQATRYSIGDQATWTVAYGVITNGCSQPETLTSALGALAPDAQLIGAAMAVPITSADAPVDAFRPGSSGWPDALPVQGYALGPGESILIVQAVRLLDARSTPVTVPSLEIGEQGTAGQKKILLNPGTAFCACSLPAAS